MVRYLDHSILNQNQLCHYGVIVQNNPAFNKPSYIMNDDTEFRKELKIQGTTIFENIFTPAEKEIHESLHMILASPHL